jgi:hypothetical protein
MSLNVCAHCTTRFAIGVPHCPQCGNADYYEEGSMAKITRHGGPSTVQDITAAPEPAPVAPVVEALEEQPELSEYAGWLRTDLQVECERRGLTKSGNKDELVDRLVEDDIARSQTSVEDEPVDEEPDPE